MKTLHKLVLKSFIGPLVATFSILQFIFLMQYIWKYIDDLVGKGLEWIIIAEFLAYASTTLVPMTLPLAVLLSSIMTLGNLGENYELIALKSAGIPLSKILRPLGIATTIICILAFLFSNYVIPVSNLKTKTLYRDIMDKKMAVNIREGVFFDNIDGYSIKAAKKAPNKKDLEDVIIYMHNERGNQKVVRAKKGRMETSTNGMEMILTLSDGYSYEETAKNKRIQKENMPFARTEFEKQTLYFDISSFQLANTDESRYESDVRMMNLGQLNSISDSVIHDFEKSIATYKEKTLRAYQIPDSAVVSKATVRFIGTTVDSMSHKNQVKIYKQATNIANNTKSRINSSLKTIEFKGKKLSKLNIEWHRKFTLAYACMVLFLIGAPLGAIIRKGGLGMPVIISVAFFLLFHILSISGEKMAKEGVIEAYQGMWLAGMVFTPIGLFLTYKATSDSTLFDIDTYFSPLKKLIQVFRKKKKMKS